MLKNMTPDETYALACEIESKIRACDECPAYATTCTMDDEGRLPKACRAFIWRWLEVVNGDVDDIREFVEGLRK